MTGIFTRSQRLKILEFFAEMLTWAVSGIILGLVVVAIIKAYVIYSPS